MAKIAASILAADFRCLEQEVVRMKEAGADYLHFDVMDGIFVPNISFGQAVLETIASLNALPCDVHLMIEKPERYIESFAKAGAKIITVHQEATTHLHRVLAQIRDCGCLAGVSLNPATPPETLRYVMGEFDLALVMTVNPGFGGQKMIPQAVTKIGELMRLLEQYGAAAEIEVDGGVSLITAPALLKEGASILVAGSALYGAKDAKMFIDEIKNI